MIEARPWLAAWLLVLTGCGERGEPAQRVELAPAERPSPRPATPGPIPLTSPTPPARPSPTPSPSPSATPAATAARSFAPADECAALPGFAPFHDKLVAAIRARDGEALAALADPAIRLDFGGGAGPDELRRRLGDPRLALWSELDAVLALGCAADVGVATMPWIFSRMPEEADPYRGMLVLGDDVPLRRRAAPDAPVVRALDWEVVALAVDGFDPKARFVEVTAPAGGRGFVETARLRSLIGYRVIADRIDGAWRITAFIAGD